MYSQIAINVSFDETRVALLEDNQLVELYVDRGAGSRLSGNIYCGRVDDILPGMQAAFVDIGIERKAFLYAGDITDNYVVESELKSLPFIPVKQRHIEDLVKAGNMVLVQVYKEPLDQKGARITTNITLSGTFLVYMPLTNHVGISHRITNEPDRLRLKTLLLANRRGEEGFIIRTQAVNLPDEEIIGEMARLRAEWEELLATSRHQSEIGLVYQDVPLSNRVIRDLFSDDISRIYIDDQDEFNKIEREVRKSKPAFLDKLVLYQDVEPLFEKFAVENQIIKALGRRINLKSGGYLVFDQTEALTSIDVNTGGYVGTDALENTAFEINCEAASKIATQIRLRNLGGMIIIDLIDMKEPEHRQRVLDEFQVLLKRDRNKTQVVQVSELGLIELTRKRIGKNLGHTLQIQCPFCTGGGRIYSPATMSNQVIRELRTVMGDKETRYIIQTHQYHTNLLKKDEALAGFIQNNNLQVEFQGILDVDANFVQVITRTAPVKES